jgi:hypothetical protein
MNALLTVLYLNRSKQVSNSFTSLLLLPVQNPQLLIATSAGHCIKHTPKIHHRVYFQRPLAHGFRSVRKLFLLSIASEHREVIAGEQPSDTTLDDPS